MDSEMILKKKEALDKKIGSVLVMGDGRKSLIKAIVEGNLDMKKKGIEKL